MPPCPAPELERAAAASYVAPRTPAEERIAELWGQILGLDKVGVETSFFELGGHSLNATRMIHRIGSELGVAVPLLELFKRPTVAALAATVDRLRAEGGEAASFVPLPTIAPDPGRRHRPFPLNQVQQAYWIGRAASMELGGVASYSYQELDIGFLDVQRLNRTMDRLIERHDMLRVVILPDGRQQILESLPSFEASVLDLSEGSQEEIGAALLERRAEMSHQVLPTDQAPILDLRVSRLPGGGARLHLGLDYMVVDAFSTGILFREFFAFYSDPDLALPELELSFRDCVLAEEKLREGEQHQRAVEYWQQRLPDLPPAPELPLACNPQELDQPRFERRTDHLPEETWRRLKRRATSFGLTPSGLLLAAFSDVLALWSKTSRFTINVTTFNRPPIHPGIQDVIGDFTTLTLLAVDTSVAGEFALRARAIQERLWQDLEHRSMGGVEVLRGAGALPGGGGAGHARGVYQPARRRW